MRKLFVGFLASSLVGIAFCQDSSAVNAQLSVSKSMSGVLLLDGGETMCGVAMLNEAYGLVAANCIPFVSTREPDMSKGYQVAVSQDGNKLYGTRGINRITVHPAYNANTFANNLAIVYFESNGAESFENSVADWPQDWSEYYFVHHRLTSNAPAVWNMPIIKVVSPAAGIDDGCLANSKLYAGNSADFLCTTLTTPWHGNSSCEAPFNMVYGDVGGLSAVAAIYSHSAIPGTGAFCGGGKVYNYYTILQHYISWISTTTGRNMQVLHHQHNGYTPYMDPGYAMQIPANNGVVEGVEVLAGYTNGLAIYGDGAEAQLQLFASLLANFLRFSESSTSTSTVSQSQSTQELVAVASGVTLGPLDYMDGRPNFAPPATVTLMSIQTTMVASIETTVATSVVTSIATTSSTTTSTTMSTTVAISTPTATITATVTFSSVQTVAAQPTTVFITLPPATQSILMTTTNTVTSNSTITISAAITVSETLAGQASTLLDGQSKPSTLNTIDKGTTGLIVAVALLLTILVGLLMGYLIRRRRQKAMGTGSDEMSRVRRWWLFGGGANEDLYNPSEYARSYNQQSQPMSKPLAY